MMVELNLNKSFEIKSKYISIYDLQAVDLLVRFICDILGGN